MNAAALQRGKYWRWAGADIEVGERQRGEKTGMWGMRGGLAAGLSFRLIPLVSQCGRIIWQPGHYRSLFIYLDAHKFHHVAYPVELVPSPCSLEVRQITIQTHTCSSKLRLECGTHECTSLNAHNMPPVLPPSFLVPLSSSSPQIQPLGLPSHVISGCVSLQTIWALRGLVDLQPSHPLLHGLLF